jgi:hypothetical protein
MASSIWDCCVAMLVFVLIIFNMQYHNLPTAILTRRRWIIFSWSWQLFFVVGFLLL